MGTDSREQATPQPPKAFMSWSGGKDASMALWTARRNGLADVRCLLTSVASPSGRVSIHGVRAELLDAQAGSVGLPLVRACIPDPCGMEAYERTMEAVLGEMRGQGITHGIHGDLFLEDIRAYRDRQLARMGMRAIYPVWGRDTRRFIAEFLDAGFKAVLVCVDARRFDRSWAGREIDRDFLRDLPAGVDPCGENGEFHSFVYDGPIFRHPVRFHPGEVHERTYKAPAKDHSADDTGIAAHHDTDTTVYFRDLLPVGR